MVGLRPMMGLSDLTVLLQESKTKPKEKKVSKNALVVIDVQNDFADQKGGLYVPGGEQVVPAINKMMPHFDHVVYTQDWHPLVTPHFQKDGGIWPVHCVQDTWGAKLHPDLLIKGPSFRKGHEGDGYSGFHTRENDDSITPTGLHKYLQDQGVDRVTVCGLATDYCVKATAIDAAHHGYHVVVPRHAVRAVNLNPGDGDQALREMKDAGVLVW